VPPVHSPVTAGALYSAAWAGGSTGRSQAALQSLESWVGRDYGPLAWSWTDSGTTALTRAIAAAVSATGHRAVALPGYACYDLATACDGADVAGVLYDLDPLTLGPSWASLERALASGVAAVVVVHLFGLPVDLGRIRALAKAHGTLVIEDAAQGVGATYDGRPVGAHGDLSILSFGRGKGLTAGGGGLLLAHDERLAAMIRSEPASGGSGWASLGKTAAQALLSAPSRYWLPASLPMLGLGETRYQPPRAGAGLSRAGAGLLARTVGLVGRAAEARREMAARWRGALASDWGGVIPGVTAGAVAGYLRFPLVLPRPWGSGDQRARRLARHGVAGGYPRSLGQLPGFSRGVVPVGGGLPGADRLAESLLTLPTHVYVQQEDIDAVVAELRSLSPRGSAG